ncbi:hypothetical protein MSG28_014680 [Choristoneura fumiferana]|uniref:Uncharacterized protein n=1 Tax=Choristoneura fumiferana TaxID=7141 RepID=A0ACC0JSA8_CHOFU|nr:hypothetical protein MSG28_014680 [Choristoneura fumiferana]
MVRDDRTHNRLGGTLIYFKRSLHVVPLVRPTLTNMEVSTCRIAMTGHRPITLVSVYLPPTKDLLKTDLEILLNLDDSVLVAGDLNSKHTRWNCRVNNRNGRVLDRLVDELNFDILAPMEETHFPTNPEHRPDILDIALLKNVTMRMRSLVVAHELSSDHRPVILELGPPPNCPPPTRSRVDWVKVGKALEDVNSPSFKAIPNVITTTDETDAAIEAFSSHLRTIISDSSKQVPAEGDRRWRLPEELRELKREKNAATRAYDSYPSELNRVRLRCLQRELKQRMSEFRNGKWDELMGEISPSHQAYWKLARSLKSEHSSAMPPLDRSDHQTPAFDDDEKAECLAASLESQCSPSQLPVDPNHLLKVENEVDRRSLIAPVDPITPVTVSELGDLVKRLRVKKAPGSDGIPNRILKMLPETLLAILVMIFNAALTNAHFPQAWKEAEVIGIHKAGKPRTKADSYRPISLLMTQGKLFERVIQTRIWNFISDKNVLIDEQFGFRSRHSCVQQVHRLTEHILKYLNIGSKSAYPTGAVFLDVAKAFDKVLIFKLYAMGLPDRLVLIIQDFLRNRSFRYKVEGTLSAPHPIRAGVPQGSVLSPTLFLLFTNDIPKVKNVQYALFADDTAIYSTSRDPELISKRLQKAITTLGNWFRLWRIEVNPAKSSAILFTRKIRIDLTSLITPIRLFDSPIPWTKKVKYLGVTLDSRMTFRPHIKLVRDRAAFIMGRLYPMLNKSSKLSFRNKLTIYKTCIRPVFSYASVVFAHAASQTSLHSLQVIQNRFLRRAIGAQWYERNVDLHWDADIPSVAQFMKQTSRRYFDSAPHHPNRLLREAVDYNPRPAVLRRFRRPRHVLTDPDDDITVINQSRTESDSRCPRTSQGDISLLNSPHRPLRRRRRRRPPQYTTRGRPHYFNRYRHVPGRFSPIRPQPD